MHLGLLDKNDATHKKALIRLNAYSGPGEIQGGVAVNRTIADNRLRP